MTSDGQLSNVVLQRIQTTVEALSSAAYIKDGELRVVAASAAFAALGGVPRDALLGHKEQLEAARDEAERRCLVFGKSQKVTIDGADGQTLRMSLVRLKREDGATFVLAVDAALDADQIVAAARDIETEPAVCPKLAADPHMPEEDLASIIETVPMGVVVTDRDLTVQLVNGPFFDIWRLTKREDIVGHNFRVLMDINRHNRIYGVTEERWEDYVAKRLAEIAEGHVPPRQFVREDGVVLMYSVTPLSAGKRMISYYDVTALEEHKRQIDSANAELQRTVRLLDDASEAMAQGLLIYDENKIVLTNQRFYEFLDVPEDEIGPGKPWWSLIEYCCARGDYGTPEEAEAAKNYIRKAAKEGEIHQMERRGRDGRWLRIDGKPARGGLTVVTYSDITELKQRETELEALVVQAEASDRAKSEFLANMSHEIRTPMNGVLGMAELLAKTELDTRQKTYCDIIVKSGNALLTIINDILDFSKIEAGEITLDAAPFDLREAIDDVAGLMTAGAKDRDIELVVSVAPEIPQMVVGDIGRFRQIMTNLVGNAVKFTERGHVLVAVDGGAGADGAAALEIRVEDTGLGIPPEKLATIFDKFSQVDGSSTRRHEGTGLGLAITSRIVALMGGSVSVASEHGKGSTFTVRLSLPVHGEAVAPARLSADLSGARVLVVDDNAVNRDILIAQLASWGCDACAAVDGREGLEVLNAAARLGVTIDCVILDHHMPGMTGLDMARIVRETPEIAETPIVFLTSVDVDPRSRGIAQLRLAAWLTKPTRETLLLETMRKVIGAHRTPGGEEAGASAQAAGRGAANAIDLDDAPLFDAADAPAAREEPSLEMWMDSEGLAESVAGIGAALSLDDCGERDDEGVADRQIERLAQSAGRPVREAQAPSLDILIAEDNEVNQIVFSQILDELGVVYRIVGNGALAVEAYQRTPPRLILMDVSMPVMNGHQATRAIRELEAGSDGRIPIIGVTAHALKGDREACMEAGMDDYLSKPISPEKLEVKIRQWIDLDEAVSDGRSRSA